MVHRCALALVLGCLLSAGGALIPFGPGSALAMADTFTVTTAADAGTGSLRQAILNADADVSGNPVSILFNISTGCSSTSGICTIEPSSVLPAITRADTTIDGFGQPGLHGQISHANTNPTLSKGSNSLILVQIDRFDLPFQPDNALDIAAANVTVEGLGIVDTGFSQLQTGILVEQSAGNTHIEGDFLGMYADGEVAANLNGVQVTGASGVVIGGTSPASVNVISGNQDGVLACGTSGLTIEGNLIGPDQTGKLGLNNGIENGDSNGVGVAIDSDALDTDACPQGSGASTNSIIGGPGLPSTTAGAGNVISWNVTGTLLHGASTKVQGNFIGLNAAGTSDLANADGVQDDGSNDIVGGATPALTNLIASNSTGIAIAGNGSTVEGNTFGRTSTGKPEWPNDTAISVSTPDCSDSASCPDPPRNASIGLPGHGNIIDGGGIDLQACRGCSVQANQLQGGAGISVGFGFGVVIGGAAPGAANTITGSFEGGVSIANLSPQTHVEMSRNVIYGNTSGGGGIGPLTVSAAADIALGVPVVNCAQPSKQTKVNDNIACPVISGETLNGATSASKVTSISGTAPAGSSVEVFTATNDSGDLGQGGAQVYLGTASANGKTCSPSPCQSGRLAWKLPAPFAAGFILDRGQPVTATATLAVHGTNPPEFDTSEFSDDFADLAPADTAVATTGDVNLAHLPCDTSSGHFIGAAHMTLRCAITEANVVPAQSVTFGIPTTDKGCVAMMVHSVHASVCTITPSAELPALTGSGSSVDGFAGSPGGARPNTGAFGAPDNSVHTIRLDKYGITICGARNGIQGLDIARGAGILFCGAGSTQPVIQGNYLGLDPNGTTADHGTGITAQVFEGSIGGSNKVTLGGVAPGDRNVIVDPVVLNNDGDTVQGNYIGTNSAGTAALTVKSNFGVGIESGGNDSLIGGLSKGAGNLVSGWGEAGILLNPGGIALQTATIIEGNRVGTNAAGTKAIPNGVGISGGEGRNNHIGPDNLISGNSVAGVSFGGGSLSITPTFPQLTVTGNVIGLDAGGKALPNKGAGIDVSGSAGVGTGTVDDVISANTIEGNAGPGIRLGNARVDVTHVVLRQNISYDNGSAGIVLTGQSNCTGPLTVSRPNDYTPCPANLKLTGTAGHTTLTGVTCPGCLVEVFIARKGPHDAGHGGSSHFLSSVTAGSCGKPPCSGNSTPFSVTGLKVPKGGLITTTATQQKTSTKRPYETSAFSGDVLVKG